MSWKNIIGTLKEDWHDTVKPALIDGLRNPDPSIVGMAVAMGALRPWPEKKLAPLPLAPQPQTEAAAATPQARPAALNRAPDLDMLHEAAAAVPQARPAALNPAPDLDMLHEAAAAVPQARPAARKEIRAARPDLPKERTYKPQPEMLTFRRLRGGGVTAQKPFSNVALLNTRNELVRLLDDVRTVVRKEKAISAQNLAKRFARTALASAANPARWEEWREQFAGDMTVKNAVLVLLEDTTALKRSSLKTMLSKARTGKK